jgi:hypothetical protein
MLSFSLLFLCSILCIYYILSIWHIRYRLAGPGSSLIIFQVWIGVARTGPSGVELNSSYQSRDQPAYKADLGNAIGLLLETPTAVIHFLYHVDRRYTFLLIHSPFTLPYVKRIPSQLFPHHSGWSAGILPILWRHAFMSGLLAHCAPRR